MKIQFSPPDITEIEIAEVSDALRSGWITTGPRTKQFEKNIGSFVGVKNVCCLNSQTACAEMALRLLGVGEGDEVITSAYTYTASASVVCHVGAKLVLVDTKPGSFEIDYDSVENAITDKTKVIIPVDIGGVPCDYKRLHEIVEHKKSLFKPSNKIQEAMGRISINADGAHSFGATLNDRNVPSYPDFYATSFHAVKNLTTAEGGALIWNSIDGVDDAELYHQLQLLSLHGQSKDAFAKTQLGAWEYDIVGTWYKCNMTDVVAAIGLKQLERYPEMLKRRKEIIEKYDAALRPLDIDTLPHYTDDHSGVCVVVPEHIKAQSKIANVKFININGIIIDGLEQQIELPSNNSLDFEKIAKDFVPDIVVFHEAYRFPYLKLARDLRKKGIPYVIIPHGELNNEAQKKKRIKKWCANLLLFNNFINKAAAIQCLSERELESTQFGKYKFIGTNGINIPKVTKTSFNTDKTVFIYIGRLDPYHKGLDLMIEAIRREAVFFRNNKCEFNIYGPDSSGGYQAVMELIHNESLEDIVHLHKAVSGTSTTFATALACFYLQIPVGHVEAGLRTYNIYSPYPEEFNRQAVGIVSQYNFAPTQLAAEHLIAEGKNPDSIYITGNTVIDAMQHTVKADYTHPELEWVGESKLIFITAHRRENLGEPMHHMFRAIRRVLDEHPDCKAVYPIHMNPVVRQAADEELGDCDRIHIIEPIEVFDCHNFEARSFLCLTDSGGIQEECPSYGVPVLVMRDTTERPEGVDAGTLRLVGTDEDVIYKAFKELLENEEAYNKMSNACNPYGDGHACERIADILEGKEYSPWVNN